MSTIGSRKSQKFEIAFPFPLKIDPLNSRDLRMGQTPSRGGYGNARSLAKIASMMANKGLF